MCAPRGKYFEDFEIGHIVKSPSRTITESDIMRFAGLSGDYNQLHTDAEMMKQSRYGERIAHGLLGLAIVSGLSSRLGFAEGTAEAFTNLKWKFRQPIMIGDTIHATFKVVRKKKVAQLEGGFVVFKINVFNQDCEIVQRGSWTALMKSKS